MVSMKSNTKRTVSIATRRKLRRLAKARWARVRAARDTGEKPVMQITPPSPLETVTALFTQVQSLDRASYEFFRTLLGKQSNNGNGTKTHEVTRSKMTGAKLARARERARRASQIRWARHREKKAEAARQAS